MSDWITEETHLPDPDVYVWATPRRSHVVMRVYGEDFSWVDFAAWRPIEQPEPYVQPAEKRQRIWRSEGGKFHATKQKTNDTLFIEVLPGDPENLDALLAQIDEPWNGVMSTREKLLWIRQARGAT